MNGKIRGITQKDKTQILEANKNFSSCALRVLAFAYKEFSTTKIDNIKDSKNNGQIYTEAYERELIFGDLQYEQPSSCLA